MNGLVLNMMKDSCLRPEKSILLNGPIKVRNITDKGIHFAPDTFGNTTRKLKFDE